MSIQSKGKLSSIWWRIAENIDQDYLELFLITSRAGGLEPTEGRSFGVGKSTLAIWMAYRAFAFHNGTLMFDGERIVDLNSEDERVKLMKHVVENYVKWTLNDVVETVRTTSKLIPALIWDDVQYSCPAYQHIPPKVRDKIEYLTRVRQRIANIILTAPSMGEIAKPLRAHINWEIIVPTRGTYEVHFIGKKRDFYNPVEDRSRLWYDVTGTFDPLPEEVDIFYKKLRDEKLNKIVEEEKEEREEEKQQPKEEKKKPKEEATTTIYQVEINEEIKDKIIRMFRDMHLTPGDIARRTAVPKPQVIQILKQSGLLM